MPARTAQHNLLLPALLFILGTAAVWARPGTADPADPVPTASAPTPLPANSNDPVPTASPPTPLPANSTGPCGPTCFTCSVTSIITPGGLAFTQSECLDEKARKSLGTPDAQLPGTPQQLGFEKEPSYPVESPTLSGMASSDPISMPGALTPSPSSSMHATNMPSKFQGGNCEAREYNSQFTACVRWSWESQNTKNTWPCSLIHQAWGACQFNGCSWGFRRYGDADMAFESSYSGWDARHRLINAALQSQSGNCGSWVFAKGWFAPTTLTVWIPNTNVWMRFHARNLNN